MLEKDEGVVLSTSRSGDTSLIATFLGRRMGKVKLMGKGILSSKSPSQGMLTVGNHLSILFYHKPNRTFYFLKEASLGSSPLKRRDSLPHLAALMSAMEILDQVCYIGSPDDRIADTAIEFVRSANAEDPLLLFLAFEIKLLASLGASPEMTSCAECGTALTSGVFAASHGASYCESHGASVNAGMKFSAETNHANHACLIESLDVLRSATISREARKELGKIIHWTYTHHVEGYHLPKSLSLI